MTRHFILIKNNRNQIPSSFQNGSLLSVILFFLKPEKAFRPDGTIDKYIFDEVLKFCAN
jgi:hypothetical protein